MLTILVPTVVGREFLLTRCLWSIQQQGGDVEVIVIDGDAGLGDKANYGATIANGSHMCVVDDDDWLDGSFVASVSPHLDVDYVGFQVLQLEDGRFYGVSRTSGDRVSTRMTRREFGPCPKGVTRIALWRETKLGNDYDADRKWQPNVQTHAFIPRCLYVYDWWPSASTFTGDGAERPDVGLWPVDWLSIHRDTLTAPEPS